LVKIVAGAGRTPLRVEWCAEELPCHEPCPARCLH
jgi:hypothetical protein